MLAFNFPPFLKSITSFTHLEIFLLLVVTALIFMIWKLAAHQECKFRGEPEIPIQDSLPALAGSTHGHILHGNSISLVQNAAYFDALEAAVGEAAVSVHLETFLWSDGVASTRVIQALVAAAGRGVVVRVLVDAVGSSDLTKESLEKMRSAGCKIHPFHPYRLRNFGRLNIRDHRKILVIDGKLAFVGGHCITDAWLHDGEKLPRHRDISARITGPVVASIQSCFLENWTEITGELFTSEATFPELEKTGPIPAHVAYVKADRCPSTVQVLHHLCIAYAHKTILIQNPYFLPDPNATRALADAAKRGVDVRVMIPALTATDAPLVTRSGRYQFKRLLESGVRIFEYQKTLLHQKIISVDGVWSGVGSSNFDDRSFEINDEITLGIADEDIAAELAKTFEDDLAECTEIQLEQWLKRPWTTRLGDIILYQFQQQF